MNWDQIEHNWTAMARRLRPELSAYDAYGDASLHASDDLDSAVRDRSERTAAMDRSDVRQTG